MGMKAVNIHDNFARNLAYKDSIMWDAYSQEQFPLFRQKINELFRDNDEPSAKNPNSAPSKAIQKIRQTVYDSVISQSKYTNKSLLATFILVTVARGTTFIEARDATKFSVHLIIRTRKCIKTDNSSDCCMVFIDEHGNVYRNWEHFIETNCLPEGVALAPHKGIYNYEGEDKNERLILDSWETPASHPITKVIEGVDVIAGVGGLGVAGGTIAGLALPALAPALPLLGAVGIGVGAYSALRSGWRLWSRSDHEQSIDPTNSSARGDWLGLASGALCVSATVANKSLASLAMAGKEVSMVREFVVNGVNISTMLLSGTGVANGILDLIMKHSDEEEITAMDVLSLAASLAIFTHSAYNFRLASTIVSQARDSKLSSYRSELSNRQRKMFDKMYKETLRTQGASKGRVDVIRLINEVPDKQYLNDMNKINKNLNKNNVRFSAGQNGQISLNDEIQVNSAALRNSVQHGIGEDYLSKVSKQVPTSHSTVSNQETFNILTHNAFYENTNNLINYCMIAFTIAEPLILNRQAFQDCVRNLIAKLGENVASFLIQKSNEFIQRFGRSLRILLKTQIYLEVVLWDLYKKCEQKIVKLTREALEENIESIFEQLVTFYESRCYESSTSQKIQCEICRGFYEICSI